MNRQELIFFDSTVMTIELFDTDFLTVNINGKVGWVISDQLREHLIEECARIFDACELEAEPYLHAAIESLQTNLTRDDFEFLEADCACSCCE